MPPDEQPRPSRKPFLLRLNPELLAELRAWANQDLRSLNGHIEFLLRDALRRRKGDRSSDRDEPS
jgi:hypothetical protein